MQNKEKFYITTAIAYASSKPHFGNTYEIIMTDSEPSSLQTALRPPVFWSIPAPSRTLVVFVKHGRVSSVDLPIPARLQFWKKE